MKPPNRLVDIARGVLIELLVVPKDDDCYIDGAKYGQLMSLLEETTLALEESDRSGTVISTELSLQLKHDSTCFDHL